MNADRLITIARRLLEQAPDGDFMHSYSAVLAYLLATHGNPRNEQFRVLFLNRKNRLIADKLTGEGTIDHCPVYVREIARHALLCDACAVVLCHNHPSGDPSPSRDDVLMTRKIVDCLALFDIVVHDHIIIGCGREHSMRAAGDLE